MSKPLKNSKPTVDDINMLAYDVEYYAANAASAAASTRNAYIITASVKCRNLCKSIASFTKL